MRYIAFDVETPNRYNSRMSAIGISVIEAGQIVEAFYSLVDPEQPFERFNTLLTGIDEEAVAEAERYDGYYLVCTSETDWDDSRVLDAYRELWRIEESFKVTKSELESRPVFVWTTPRIEAHFLTCYVALAILRLLQRATGLPAARIREEIAAMSCSALDANWWLFDHRTDESDAILEAVGLPELRRKVMRTGEIKAVFAKARKAGIPHKKRSSE